MLKKIVFLACLVHYVYSDWGHVGDGCIGARDNKYKEMTYTGSNSFIGAVKLVHKSGYVGCYGAARSNWGCKSEDTRLEMMVTDATNQVIYPSGRLVTKVGHGRYKLPGFTSSSPELVLTDFGNPTYLKYGDKLRIWYAEDFYGSAESDNHGSTCVEVYCYKMAI